MKGIVMDNKEVVKTGITFGTALAIAISWSTHHSILWAILHGFFSWFYVIYYALTRRSAVDPVELASFEALCVSSSTGWARRSES